MEKMDFKRISSLWLEDKSHYARPSTIAAYSFILKKHLIPAFGTRECITETDAQEFAVRTIEKGLSRNYLKGMINVLKMVLHYGARHGFDVPMHMEVRIQKETRNREPDVFSNKEQKALLKYIWNNVDYMNIGVYMSLAFGLRIGEVCALKWQDLDFKAGLIHINKTMQRIYFPEESGINTKVVTGPPKSVSSIREIPMTEEFRQLMDRILQKSDADPLSYVISGSRKAMEPRSYRNHYRSLLEHLGLSRIKYHGLRHSFATRCIDCRSDYKIVSSILGHSSVNTTLNLYVHPNIEQKRECLEKITGMIADGEQISSPAKP